MKWTRNEDGSYTTTGELPQSAWVKISMDGEASWGVPHRIINAVSLIESAIRSGHARKLSYELMPVEAPKTMNEETKAKLLALSADKRANKPPAPMHCLQCGKELPIQQGRGRRRHFCSPECRIASKKSNPLKAVSNIGETTDETQNDGKTNTETQGNSEANQNEPQS
jgi:hypothetical protein